MVKAVSAEQGQLSRSI